MSDKLKVLLFIVVTLLGINIVLYKINHNTAVVGKAFQYSGKVAVVTDRVASIQNVVIDSATGSQETRLVSTDEFADRFAIPADMELIVGQRYEFTIKRDGQGYPRALDAVQK